MLTRRTHLGHALAAAATLFSASFAAPLQAQRAFRLAHSYATVTQHHRNAEFFKAELERLTGGRLRVDIFPASQLMPITQEIPGILGGQIQAAYSLNMLAATLDPLWGFFELPFVFDISPDNQRHLREFVRSERGGGVLKRSLEARGLKVLAIAPTDIGAAVINTRRPIARLEDFAGLKIRTPGGRYLADTLRHLGASPIAMAFAEFAPAIVQGTVDGTVTGVIFTHDNRIPVRHLSVINLWYAGLPLLMSKRFFDGLPADQQRAALDAGRALEDYGFRATEAKASERLRLIESEMGVRVQPPLGPNEIARMRAATQPVIETFLRENPAGRALLEEARRLA